MKKTTLFTGFLILIFLVQSSIIYAQLSESYNLLSTLAGKGDTEGRANDWLPEYENGSAVGAELSRPHMAMADLLGNIYIADKGAHSIRKVDIEGIITTVAGTNTAGDGIEGIAIAQDLNAPNGLWVKSDGTFYILDLNNDKIKKVDTDGNLTTVVDDTEGITLGRGLWVSAAEDTIWYASGSIIKRWTTETGITTFASGFRGLGNITQDPNGYIVATDRSGNSVYRLDSQGNKTRIAGNGSDSGGGDGVSALETAFHGVRGINFLPDGSFFLATHEGSQVWFIDTDGIAYLFLEGREDDDSHSGDGEHFQTPGDKISEARAISIDYEGNVLITENDRGFIRKIDKAAVNSILNRSLSNSSKLKIFPNPVKSEITIEINSKIEGECLIQISNMLGKTVHSQLINMTLGTKLIQIPCDELANGIYFLTTQAGETFSSQQIIVQH